jgi:hypothetical protein
LKDDGTGTAESALFHMQCLSVLCHGSADNPNGEVLATIRGLSLEESEADPDVQSAFQQLREIIPAA